MSPAPPSRAAVSAPHLLKLLFNPLRNLGGPSTAASPPGKALGLDAFILWRLGPVASGVHAETGRQRDWVLLTRPEEFAWESISGSPPTGNRLANASPGTPRPGPASHPLHRSRRRPNIDLPFRSKSGRSTARGVAPAMGRCSHQPAKTATASTTAWIPPDPSRPPFRDILDAIATHCAALFTGWSSLPGSFSLHDDRRKRHLHRFGTEVAL